MEWLAGLSVRTVLIIVAVLLAMRTGIARGLSGRLPDLLRDTLREIIEITLVSVVVVFLVLHRFLFQLFFIPSGSMIPTLAIQDRILVNKWVYRFHLPRRGDIVIFHAPRAASEEPKDYVKRVVGLPGETVSVVPDTVYLDGRPLASIVLCSEARRTSEGLLVADEARVRVQADRVLVDGHEVLITAERGRVQWLGPSLIVDGRVELALNPGESLRLRPLRPTWDGIQAEGWVVSSTERPRLVVVKGRRLSLRPGYVCVNGQPLPETYTAQGPRYHMKPVRLAVGQYLMLGDNRNNSRDSHLWGPLDGRRIVGRVEAIYWPFPRACWMGSEPRFTHAGL